MTDFLHYQLQGTIRETFNLFKKGTCSFGTKTSGFFFGWIRHNTSAIREKMLFMHFMIVLMTILIIVIMTTTLSRILQKKNEWFFWNFVFFCIPRFSVYFWGDFNMRWDYQNQHSFLVFIYFERLKVTYFAFMCIYDFLQFCNCLNFLCCLRMCIFLMIIWNKISTESKVSQPGAAHWFLFGVHNVNDIS